MGFEVDKTEIQKHQTEIVSEPLEETVVLSSAETEELTSGLSGESITAGFSEFEAEALTTGIAGDAIPIGDDFLKTDVEQNNIEDKTELNYINEAAQINETIKHDNNLGEIKPDNFNKANSVEPNEENQINESSYVINYDGKNIDIKTLSTKELREYIGSINNLELLKEVGLKISNLEFSKAEKQMLQIECIKKQGVLQNTDNSGSSLVTNTEPEIRDKFDEHRNKRLKSKTEYDLFKDCKTPIQRELAKTITSNEKLYLFENGTETFKQILCNCSSEKELDMFKEFTEKASQNIKIINENGAFNENVIETIVALSPDNITYKLALLDEYKNSNTQLCGYVFSFLLKNCNKEQDLNAITNFMNNKKVDIDRINSQTDYDSMTRLMNALRIYDEFDEKDFENITAYENTRLIASTYEQIKEDEDRVKFVKILLKNDELYKNEPIILNDENSDFCKEIHDLIVNTESSKQISFKVLSEVLNNKSLDSDQKQNFTEIKKCIDPNFLNFINRVISVCTVEEKENENENKNIVSNAANVYLSENYAKCVIDFVKNDFKLTKEDKAERKIIGQILENDKEIYSNFTQGRSYTNEDLINLFHQSQKDYNHELLFIMCKQKDYSAENILTIMENTPFYAINLTKKILKTRNLTAKQKADVISAIGSNREISSAVEKLIDDNNLNMSTLPKILETSKKRELENNDSVKFQEENFTDEKDDNTV